MTKNPVSATLPTPGYFSIEIESLRGLAALSVVLGHFYILLNLPKFFPPQSYLVNTIIANLLDPQPAVLLFFTISGLVLGRQLRKEPINGLPSFVAYLCRRGFRLIPLMWATTCVAFFLHYCIRPMGISVLYANLLLQDISLNLPLWSLKVELYCSIFFPLLFWMFRTGGVIYNCLLFSSFILLSYFWHEPIFMQFWVFFHAGLLIDIISTNSKQKKLSNPLILLLFYLLFAFAPQFGTGTRNWAYGAWQSWVLPEIVACSFILFFVVHHKHSPINYLLRLPLIRYFGKISFSIYLVHFPLLKFMLVKFPIAGTPQLIEFTLGYFTQVLLLASLSYRWIELPANRLGKNLSAFILTRTMPLGIEKASV